MTPSSIDAERRIRAAFPIVRFFQGYMPLSIASWLNSRAAKHARLPAEVARRSVSAAGVPCEWLVPHDSPKDQVLLYLHGGGFVYGLTHLHLQMVAYLSKKMNVRALVVDYRLGPKHPYPAALDDCITAYHWLLKQGFEAQNIVVAGDSAGGNLTITTLMKLRDGGEPLVAAAACLSPAVDLSNNDGGPKAVHDPLLPRRAIRIYNTSYVADHDARDPLISPVYGDWHGLPPLLVHAGEDELLRDDVIRIEKLARAAGVDVRVEVYPRMWHVWQLFLELPQARQSLSDIAQFLVSQLAHEPTLSRAPA